MPCDDFKTHLWLESKLLHLTISPIKDYWRLTQYCIPAYCIAIWVLLTPPNRTALLKRETGIENCRKKKNNWRTRKIGNYSQYFKQSCCHCSCPQFRIFVRCVNGYLDVYKKRIITEQPVSASSSNRFELFLLLKKRWSFLLLFFFSLIFVTCGSSAYALLAFVETTFFG